MIDPRTVETRFSWLKRMAQSPAHYLQSLQGDGERSLASRLGSGAHAVAFEQPYVVFETRRAGKVWDAFEAEHADEIILSTKEHDKAQAIAASLRAHPVASRLLFSPDAITEQRIHWQLDGRAVGSTPDVRTDSYIVDLKTTKCAEPEKFMRDAFWRAYHAQLTFYDEAVKSITGRETPNLYIVAVESAAPYPVVVMRLTPAARLAGQRMWRLWWEQLRQCEENNSWPGYTSAIVDFDVADESAGIIIEDDGEEWAA